MFKWKVHVHVSVILLIAVVSMVRCSSLKEILSEIVGEHQKEEKVHNYTIASQH